MNFRLEKLKLKNVSMFSAEFISVIRLVPGTNVVVVSTNNSTLIRVNDTQ
jgi:hypothetical protein